MPVDTKCTKVGTARFTVPFRSLLASPLKNGIYKSPSYHGRGAKIVNMGELFANPRLSAIPMNRVELSRLEAEQFGLQQGDLLFARRSLVLEGAGKCIVVVEVAEQTTFESSIIRARPDPSKADSIYLYYFFSSKIGQQCLSLIRRQVAVAGITGSDLALLEIPLLPLPEQHKIAAVLSDVDALINGLERLISKKRELKQAVMQQLLTGKTRLPGFNTQWDEKRLGNISTFVGSGTSKFRTTFGRYPLYGSTGVIGYTETADYEGDAILVARVGANAGALNLVGGNYGVTDNTILLKLNNEFSLQFFLYQLEAKRLNRLVFGSGQPLLTGTQLKALLVWVPHPDEQASIAAVLSDIDAELTGLEQRRDKTRMLKQGLMQELLTGGIRLI